MTFDPSAYGNPSGRSKRVEPTQSTFERQGTSAAHVTHATPNNPAHERLHHRNIQNPSIKPPGAAIKPAVCAEDTTHIDKQHFESLSEQQPTNQSLMHYGLSNLTQALNDSVGFSWHHIDSSTPLAAPTFSSEQKAAATSTTEDWNTNRGSLADTFHPRRVCRSAHGSEINKLMMNTTNNGVTSRSDLLQNLQSDELHRISRKDGAERAKGRDKHQTTSLKDLYLARRPLDTNNPATSGRPWAEGSPIIDANCGEQYTIITGRAKQESNTTQASPSRHQIGEHAPPTVEFRNSALPSRRKWATKEEMGPKRQEAMSNDWGSAAPSDETRESNISDQSFGKLLRRGGDKNLKTSIQDWQGQFLPAPADWDDRPRFNNNNAIYKDEFKKWISSVSHASHDKQKRRGFGNGLPYLVIPPVDVLDDRNHPDGISMVSRYVCIDRNNAKYYGYADDLDEGIKYSDPLYAQDFDDWGKLDRTNRDNDRYGNETTQDLVDHWLKHLANWRRAFQEAGYRPKSAVSDKPEEAMPTAIPSDKRYVPALNIYLRPATQADLSELTRIYNWYIINGVGPSETREIDESDMRTRIEMSKDSQLPFMVAANRNQRGAEETHPMDDEEIARRLNLPVTHKSRTTLTRIEKLSGFACANDLTATDYIEHISAEIEVYVDASYRRMGVGKCLMDRMLQICDRGHRLTTECTLHCDQRLRHFYGPGGNREVHKLFILLKKWHVPKPAVLNVERPRKHRQSAMEKTNEDEYGQWLRQWLESLGFEVEGVLRKIGARNGRYIDIVYFGRETAWSPAEGSVPAPKARHEVSAHDFADDEQYG